MSTWFWNRFFLTSGVVLIVCGFSGAGDADAFNWYALADRTLGVLLGFGAFTLIEKGAK